MVLNNRETSSVGERAARVYVESETVNSLWYKATPPLSSGCPGNFKSSRTAVNAAFFPLIHSTWTMRFVVKANRNLRSRDDMIATSPLRICPRVFFLRALVVPCSKTGPMSGQKSSCGGMCGTYIRDDSTWPPGAPRHNNSPGRRHSRVTTTEGQHKGCVRRGRYS